MAASLLLNVISSRPNDVAGRGRQSLVEFDKASEAALKEAMPARQFEMKRAGASRAFCVHNKHGKVVYAGVGHFDLVEDGDFLNIVYRGRSHGGAFAASVLNASQHQPLGSNEYAVIQAKLDPEGVLPPGLVEPIQAPAPAVLLSQPAEPPRPVSALEQSVSSVVKDADRASDALDLVQDIVDKLHKLTLVLADISSKKK